MVLRNPRRAASKAEPEEDGARTAPKGKETAAKAAPVERAPAPARATGFPGLNSDDAGDRIWAVFFDTLESDYKESPIMLELIGRVKEEMTDYGEAEGEEE